MQRQRGDLVPIDEVIGGLGGPVQALREASPQALHHYSRFDQVNQLVSASEADPDRGFMARLAAVAAGIGGGIAATKKKEPYSEITDGVRSIRLRVHKEDHARFEDSLDEFRSGLP